MKERIAVETLTLAEISDIFQESIEIAFPKSKGAIADKLKKLKKAGISSHRWIKTYEEFKGAKLNFYCEKISSKESPIVSIGMTCRTLKGMLLITVDTSNGGLLLDQKTNNSKWDKWIKIYTGHCCERYAQRIIKIEQPTFNEGSEEIMFSDLLGPVRITDTIADGIEEIEFQFKEGQAYGYRDSTNKIIYFRTVYSNDMLKQDRLNFKNEWQYAVEELQEIFRWK